MSITKPSPDYINRIASYLTYRTKTLQHVTEQVVQEKHKHSDEIKSVFSTKDRDMKSERNIRAQLTAIAGSALTESVGEQHGLMNPFTGEAARDQNSHDLLNFRKRGEEEYLLRISYFTLKTPSVQAPNRRRALKTFSTKQVNKRRVNQLERDRSLVLSAIKKKIQFSQKTGKPIDRPGEQLLVLPLSLTDNEGNPLKGQKSYFTRSLEARYKQSTIPIVTPYLPEGWELECSIIEGMFLINTSPLRTQTTMTDYALFLLRRFIVSQFHKGSKEVHVIFDNPGHLKNIPKYEQKRRDKATQVLADHKCDDITSDSAIPHKKWRESLINCRRCKRTLAQYIGKFFLSNASTYLSSSQTLYVAGTFDGELINTAWLAYAQDNPQPDPAFTCIAEETDTRLRLHVRKTQHKNILARCITGQRI